MLKTVILAGAAALVLSGAAAAQDGPPRSRVDVDGDRRISLSEMQAAHAQRFVRLDVNRDGRLTQAERQAGRQAIRAERTGRRAERQAAMFSRRDTDRDGALSAAEAPKRLAERFAQVDVNRDGRLTAQELQAGRMALRSNGRGPGRDSGTRQERGGRADADGDRVVTRAESEAQVRARFARLDANRDGFVTRDERRAQRQHRRGQA